MEIYLSVENDNPLNNTVLEENLKQAQLIIKKMENIKNSCFLGLEIMVQEFCQKNTLSFSSGMGTPSFEFKINNVNVWLYDDGITFKKEKEKLRQLTFKNKQELEKLINNFENDLNESENKDDIEYFQECLKILNKINFFYLTFEYLIKESKKIETIFNISNALEQIKDIKNV